MKRAARKLTTILYALGVLGALTFGASQAFGRAVQRTCPYNPPTRLGECVEPGWNDECRERCQAITGDPTSDGTCDAGPYFGCCTCLMR